MAAPDLTWQGSLFAAGDPRPDQAFATLVRHDLARGAWVDHAPGWLQGGDDLFALLAERVAWGQRQRWMYTQRVDEPRLTASWPRDEPPPEAPPVLEEMAARLSARYGPRFDAVGLNLYRDGHDSVAWHGDRIARTVPDPLVAIVSLGGTRRFLLRPVAADGRVRRFDLRSGDLLVMGGTGQRTWQHSVPKATAAGARISVTFRHSRPTD